MREDFYPELSVGDAQSNLQGVMLPERVLQDLLKWGFGVLNDDTSLIDDLFHKLDKKSLTNLKHYYDTHDITVRTNFPSDSFTWPIVSIVNADDSENPQMDVLGDFLGDSVNAAGTEVSRLYGHALNSRFDVYCLTGGDSNAALYLYYLVKAILLLNMQALHVHGLSNITFSGRDVQLREDLFPEFTYARVLSVNCNNYFSVSLTERAAKSLQLRIFTEDEETGIKTQVTED